MNKIKKYKVIRTEYDGNKVVEKASVGWFNTEDDADKAINEDVSEFRDEHDNDERIDWNIVDIYNDIGKCRRFVWSAEICNV